MTAYEYYEQGRKMLDEGKLVLAMEFFQASIEADKHFEKAYLLLSEVYEIQGKKDKAKATLYGLLALEPKNEEAHKKIDLLDKDNPIEIPYDAKTERVGKLTKKRVPVWRMSENPFRVELVWVEEE